MLNIQSITSDLKWLGALDPDLRTFDIIMHTEFGTTYNAYFLQTSEGGILFETVKDKYFDTYLEKIKSITSLDAIQYIVVDHTEPDHAGSVCKLLAIAPHITVIGSALAIKYLSQMINAPFKSKIVKEGDTVKLGNKTLYFISVPQLHWPDTMYTLIEEDKALITCDSFGAHYSCENILKSALPADKEEDFVSAYQYYFDMIMGPFKPFVQKALAKIAALDFDYICPGHGLVLEKENMQKYIALYDKWSQPITHDPSIVVAYVSAYGYTAQMAEAIVTGLKQGGYTGTIHLCNAETESLASILEKVNTAQALILGSPTILQDTLPPIAQILLSLNPVVHKHLTMGCFGSYGWSGEALHHMAERIAQLKCPMPLQPLGVIFKPSETDLSQCIAYGKDFAQHLK